MIYVRWLLSVGVALVLLPTLLLAAVVSRWRSRPQGPRLAWGSVPIMNNSYWARAMRAAGFESETFTDGIYSIHNRPDWDRLLSEQWTWCPRRLKPYLAFAWSLQRYDVFFIPFSGFFLGETALRGWQHVFFRIALKKVVVIPYGADAYVYRRVRSMAILHALLESYPRASREQSRIARDVDYWVRWGDCVIPGWMGPDGVGRWDVLIPSALCVDLEAWRPQGAPSDADGVHGEVVVAHAPNHRGFKGTEFVLRAVSQLRAEGLRVRLVLLEGVKNSEVRRVFAEEVDILVEQLLFQGYALNAVESLASGVVTISNLEDEEYIRPFRRWSYFDECPIVSATPETVYGVLRELVLRPELRRQLAWASREYATKYHGFDSAQHLFTEVVAFVLGNRQSLQGLFHPLKSTHVNRLPVVSHPLVANRLPR